MKELKKDNKDVVAIMQIMGAFADVISELPQEEQDVWRMAVAADLMHDVSEENRKMFIENLERVREEVIKEGF